MISNLVCFDIISNVTWTDDYWNNKINKFDQHEEEYPYNQLFYANSEIL